MIGLSNSLICSETVSVQTWFIKFVWEHDYLRFGCIVTYLGQLNWMMPVGIFEYEHYETIFLTILELFGSEQEKVNTVWYVYAPIC